MKLAISNIAWLPAERHDAYSAMQTAGIQSLEVAPGMLFYDSPDPFLPDVATTHRALEELRQYGLTLISMQALLFGVQGAALFGDEKSHAAFRAGISRAITLAGRFDIPNLVVGSPRQRCIPEGMNVQTALSLAADTFRDLGDEASAAGTILAMEANPSAYGTNFLNTWEEAVAFVEQVDHPAVALTLDLGAMHMNGTYETVPQVITLGVERFSHVHVSEANLAPAPADPEALAPVLTALHRSGYKKGVSIEMKRPERGISEVHRCIAALARAASLAQGAVA